MMHILFLLLLSSLSTTVFAAQPEVEELEPLPPPLDTASSSAFDDEPQVTITKQSGQIVEEYRVGGELYMIKITPKHGVPYYLVDDRGDGKFSRQESLDSGLQPPRWIIKRF